MRKLFLMVVYEKKFYLSFEQKILTKHKKNLLIDNPYKTIYQPFRSECSSRRVINGLYHHGAEYNKESNCRHFGLIFKQECIPVGCVPPDCWPYSSMHCAGGICPGGVSAQVNVCPGVLSATSPRDQRQTPPSPCGQTDTCEKDYIKNDVVTFDIHIPARKWRHWWKADWPPNFFKIVRIFLQIWYAHKINE